MTMNRPRVHNPRPRSSSRSDRGEATTQMVILTPILALLVFLGVQSAVYFHAANVAHAAASQGAAAASFPSSGANEAITVAQSTVNDLGSHAARTPNVTIADGYVTVSVEVLVPRIVPFFPRSVTRTVLEPQERFVPESDR
jgi:Flp pilus assembly protein TadG